jgi:hypothetical protein
VVALLAFRILVGNEPGDTSEYSPIGGWTKTEQRFKSPCSMGLLLKMSKSVQFLLYTSDVESCLVSAPASKLPRQQEWEVIF